MSGFHISRSTMTCVFSLNMMHGPCTSANGAPCFSKCANPEDRASKCYIECISPAVLGTGLFLDVAAFPCSTAPLSSTTLLLHCATALLPGRGRGVLGPGQGGRPPSGRRLGKVTWEPHGANTGIGPTCTRTLPLARMATVNRRWHHSHCARTRYQGVGQRLC